MTLVQMCPFQSFLLIQVPSLALSHFMLLVASALLNSLSIEDGSGMSLDGPFHDKKCF